MGFLETNLARMQSINNSVNNIVQNKRQHRNELINIVKDIGKNYYNAQEAQKQRDFSKSQLESSQLFSSKEAEKARREAEQIRIREEQRMADSYKDGFYHSPITNKDYTWGDKNQFDLVKSEMATELRDWANQRYAYFSNKAGSKANVGNLYTQFITELQGSKFDPTKDSLEQRLNDFLGMHTELGDNARAAAYNYILHMAQMFYRQPPQEPVDNTEAKHPLRDWFRNQFSTNNQRETPAPPMTNTPQQAIQSAQELPGVTIPPEVLKQPTEQSFAQSAPKGIPSWTQTSTSLAPTKSIEGAQNALDWFNQNKDKLSSLRIDTSLFGGGNKRGAETQFNKDKTLMLALINRFEPSGLNPRDEAIFEKYMKDLSDNDMTPKTLKQFLNFLKLHQRPYQGAGF